VAEDLKIAAQYNIHSAPALIINGKQSISGAKPLAVLQTAICSTIESFEKENTSLSGASCTLQGDTWECD